MKLRYLLLLFPFLLLLAACPAQTSLPNKPGNVDCPEVNTLDPSAFKQYPAGSCVTLGAAVVGKPKQHIWCPANSELPPTGNLLSLIGEIKTLLRREGNEFSVVAPEGKSVVFVPLKREGNYLMLDQTRLFQDLGDGRYLCLIDTLVSKP